MVPGAVAGLDSARRWSPFRVRAGHRCDGGPGDRPDERGRRGLRLFQGALPVLPAAARSARLRGLSRAWEAASVRRLRSRGRDRDRSCPPPDFQLHRRDRAVRPAVTDRRRVAAGENHGRDRLRADRDRGDGGGPRRRPARVSRRRSRRRPLRDRARGRDQRRSDSGRPTRRHRGLAGCFRQTRAGSITVRAVE